MNIKILSFSFALLALLTLSSQSYAEGSCEVLINACNKAGFLVGGGVKPNTELWQDCAMPLYQGKKTNHKLPKIKSSDLNKCRAENPNFGSKGKEL